MVKQKRKNDNRENSKTGLVIIITLVIIVLLTLTLGIIFRKDIFSNITMFSNKNQNAIIKEQNNVVVNKINETDRYEYNGLAFIKQGKFWTTTAKIHDYEYYLELYYGPREVEDINIKYNMNNFTFLTSRYGEAYIVFNPKDTNLTNVALASATLSKSLTDVYNIIPIAACTERVPECETRPIIAKCEARPDRAIILIQSANETRIEYSKNCLVVQGKNEELLRAMEKTRLGWYGIIN